MGWLAPADGASCRRNDFQFFPPRLVELQEKESLYFRVRLSHEFFSLCRADPAHSQKTQGYVVPLREDPAVSPDDLEAEQAAEQELIETGASRFSCRLTRSLTASLASSGAFDGGGSGRKGGAR